MGGGLVLVVPGVLPWGQTSIGSPIVIDKDLLDILACPKTHQSLAEAGADLLAKVNAKIEAGTCENVGGAKVEAALDGGLIREDGQVIYPIRDSIPVLLIDEGIVLE